MYILCLEQVKTTDKKYIICKENFYTDRYNITFLAENI